MKILAVDDDPLLLEVLEKLLSGVGYSDVTLAEGPQEALEHIHRQSSPFECILMDIQMPEMDGIELCSQLRRMPDYREVPIVMLTAMHDKSFVDDAFAAGASDYVTKPFDVVDLGIRIRRVHREQLERQQQRVQEIHAPFSLEKVQGGLSCGALEDYLEGMPSRERRGACVFAVRLDDMQLLQRVGGPREYRDVIVELAGCIAAELAPERHAQAYCGDGRYVCVLHSDEMLDREAFETRLQERLDRRGLTGRDGGPLDLRLHVGTPMRPRMSVSGGAQALIARVLERLDQNATGARSYEMIHPALRRVTGE